MSAPAVVVQEYRRSLTIPVVIRGRSILSWGRISRAPPGLGFGVSRLTMMSEPEGSDQGRIDERDAPRDRRPGPSPAGSTLVMTEEEDADDRPDDDRGQAAGLGRPFPGQGGDQRRRDGRRRRSCRRRSSSPGRYFSWVARRKARTPMTTTRTFWRATRFFWAGVLFHEPLVDVAHDASSTGRGDNSCPSR